MGFWGRLFDQMTPDVAPQSSAPGFPVYAFESLSLGDPRLPEFLRGGATTKSGKIVTERSALSNATFNRAVNVVTGTMGMLPLNLHRRLPSGIIEKAEGHPVQKLLRQRPNKWQRPYQFKSYMQGRAMLTGNAYAYIVPGVRGPQAIVPLDPRLVTVEQTDDFDLTYRYRPNSGGERVFSSDRMFHLRAPWSSDGITGDGLLKVAAEVLGLAETADEAASRLLKNGAYVGGVLKHPKTLSKEAVERLKQQFQERFAGAENAGRWMVAEEGLDPTPFGMSGKDAEGLAQRKHQAEEVSRFTGVPRPLLMFDETSWGSGIEQLGLFLVTYCLLPWFNAWEEVAADALLTEAERGTHYVKFNEAALLRGSLKDQAEFLSKAVGGPGQGGWMVPDEAREKFDMNPMEGDIGKQPAWGMTNEPTQPPA